MAITDPLVLPEDVVLVPVAELPEDVRSKLGCEEGDFAITRPRLRVSSRILDPDSARLLAEFRSPTTVAEAVIRYSRERGTDPEETLTEAYPLLDRLFGAGFLVAEGSVGAEVIKPSLEPGEEIAGFQVLDCIQVLVDTELHQVRREGQTAALKLERLGANDAEDAEDAREETARAFEREAAVLAHLDGAVSPRLLAAGEDGGRRYVATEWRAGIDAATAAAELRQARSREGLLALVLAVARAYARLHERGVVHGDVHPRNVLVTAAGEAILLDFGYARLAGRDDLKDPGRGGVGFFFEPEYAAAVLAGGRVPAASPAGEQHAVAALLYLLVTGAHYRDFSLGREEMLRQIAGEPPLPFAERGVEPWPEVEAVLARALAKDPEARFPSMTALADGFAALPPPPRMEGPRPAGLSRTDALLDRVVESAGLAGTLLSETLPPPRASVKGGAAGIACALYRVATAREDAGLLSLADVWAEKAAREEGDEAYFKPGGDGDSGSRGILPEVVGPVSIYHSPTGTRCVQALIAHALGNPAAQRRAVQEFLAVAREPCPNPDLALGRSGVLLAASLLLDTLEGDLRPELVALGEGLLAGIWEEIDLLPPVSDCAERPNLGIAHGWAGYLYATLQWCRAAARPLPPNTETRLRELAGCARPRGRGLCWPWLGESGASHGTMPGWCNGSAGFVFLWTLAHRQLGGPELFALAEGASWNAWEDPSGSANLCCGLTGRAYALLNFHKSGGGEEWLGRARDLAEQAAQTFEQGGAETLHGLFWGEAGAAALAADLAQPRGAAFPCFEDEGW